jgi:hypothetical protein
MAEHHLAVIVLQMLIEPDDVPDVLKINKRKSCSQSIASHPLQSCT